MEGVTKKRQAIWFIAIFFLGWQYNNFIDLKFSLQLRDFNQVAIDELPKPIEDMVLIGGEQPKPIDDWKDCVDNGGC